jgi:cell division protease FtsH
MCDDLSFIQYSHDESKGGYQFQNEYSVETGNRLDEEVRKLIDGQFERAKKILLDHRDQLTLLSESLLKKETMSAYEVKTLLGFEINENDFLTAGEKASEIKEDVEVDKSTDVEGSEDSSDENKAEASDKPENLSESIVESAKDKKEKTDKAEISKDKDAPEES